MSQKIILSSEEVIVCPKCQYKFPLGDGITRQTIERYEQDFEAVLKERSAELRLELEKEAGCPGQTPTAVLPERRPARS